MTSADMIWLVIHLFVFDPNPPQGHEAARLEEKRIVQRWPAATCEDELAKREKEWESMFRGKWGYGFAGTCTDRSPT